MPGACNLPELFPHPVLVRLLDDPTAVVSLVRMKTILSLVLLVCLLLVPVNSAKAALPAPEDVYTRFVRNMATSRPASFSCIVGGDAVLRSLGRIPADARQGRPVVRTWYRRDVGQVIRVENVDPSFKNLFSAYQSYLGMTGAWLAARGRDWREFSAQYSMQILGSSQQSILAKIATRGRENDSWGEFTFSAHDMSVQSVRFFSRNSLIYTVQNLYGRIGGYLLPTSMVITAWNNGTTSSVSRLVFSEYRLNPVVPDAVFSR